MAMMDDMGFLVSHIRNSFITSDETGMCELIIENDETQDKHRDKRPPSWHGQRTSSRDSARSESGLDADTELPHSYDIIPDMDFAGHRRRSNTAQRLERLKKEKHKQSKIKHIHWKVTDQAVDELGEYFEKKDITPKPGRHKSALSLLMEQYASIPNNPFMDYAKFDGKTVTGLPTKKIAIFLTMAGPADRPYPMTVVTLATAKVYDLIGLICWQYTNEGRQPALIENLEAYCLHIAEDDGEVDMDFPALDPKEPIIKFGFKKLALVEKDLPPPSPRSSTVVTINMPSRGFSKIPVDTLNVPMRNILNTILRKRKLRQVKGLEYKLERQTEPGVTIDLDSPLDALGTLEFCLVRENSIRGDMEDVVMPTSMSEMAESLSSHQYKSYRVNMAHKLRTNTEVQLGISGEKIEIDPVSSKGKLFRQRAMTYDTEDIATCTLHDSKSTGKSTARLIYQAGHHDYRHHDFETDSTTAKEIVQKVSNILEMRSSPVRKEYLSHKERKMYKRQSSIL